MARIDPKAAEDYERTYGRPIKDIDGVLLNVTSFEIMVSPIGRPDNQVQLKITGIKSASTSKHQSRQLNPVHEHPNIRPLLRRLGDLSRAELGASTQGSPTVAKGKGFQSHVGDRQKEYTTNDQGVTSVKGINVQPPVRLSTSVKGGNTSPTVRAMSLLRLIGKQQSENKSTNLQEPARLLLQKSLTDNPTARVPLGETSFRQPRASQESSQGLMTQVSLHLPPFQDATADSQDEHAPPGTLSSDILSQGPAQTLEHPRHRGDNAIDRAGTNDHNCDASSSEDGDGEDEGCPYLAFYTNLRDETLAANSDLSHSGHRVPNHLFDKYGLSKPDQSQMGLLNGYAGKTAKARLESPRVPLEVLKALDVLAEEQAKFLANGRNAPDIDNLHDTEDPTTSTGEEMETDEDNANEEPMDEDETELPQYPLESIRFTNGTSPPVPDSSEPLPWSSSPQRAPTYFSGPTRELPPNSSAENQLPEPRTYKQLEEQQDGDDSMDLDDEDHNAEEADAMDVNMGSPPLIPHRSPGGSPLSKAQTPSVVNISDDTGESEDTRNSRERGDLFESSGIMHNLKASSKNHIQETPLKAANQISASGRTSSHAVLNRSHPPLGHQRQYSSTPSKHGMFKTAPVPLLSSRKTSRTAEKAGAAALPHHKSEYLHGENSSSSSSPRVEVPQTQKQSVAHEPSQKRLRSPERHEDDSKRRRSRKFAWGSEDLPQEDPRAATNRRKREWFRGDRKTDNAVVSVELPRGSMKMPFATVTTEFHNQEPIPRSRNTNIQSRDQAIEDASANKHFTVGSLVNHHASPQLNTTATTNVEQHTLTPGIAPQVSMALPEQPPTSSLPVITAQAKFFQLWKDCVEAYRFGGNLKLFKNICARLVHPDRSQLRVSPNQWDAWLIRHDRFYRPYLMQCADDGEEPMTFDQFWSRNLGGDVGVLRKPPVLTPQVLQELLPENAGGEGHGQMLDTPSSTGPVKIISTQIPSINHAFLESRPISANRQQSEEVSADSLTAATEVARHNQSGSNPNAEITTPRLKSSVNQTPLITPATPRLAISPLAPESRMHTSESSAKKTVAVSRNTKHVLSQSTGPVRKPSPPLNAPLGPRSQRSRWTSTKNGGRGPAPKVKTSHAVSQLDHHNQRSQRSSDSFSKFARYKSDQPYQQGSQQQRLSKPLEGQNGAVSAWSSPTASMHPDRAAVADIPEEERVVPKPQTERPVKLTPKELQDMKDMATESKMRMWAEIKYEVHSGSHVRQSALWNDYQEDFGKTNAQQHIMTFMACIASAFPNTSVSKMPKEEEPGLEVVCISGIRPRMIETTKRVPLKTKAARPESHSANTSATRGGQSYAVSSTPLDTHSPKGLIKDKPVTRLSSNMLPRNSSNPSTSYSRPMLGYPGPSYRKPLKFPTDPSMSANLKEPEKKKV